jgi:hypothetical protein
MAAWERIYAVHEYDDGPVRGVADRYGVPHAFERGWDPQHRQTSSVSPVCLQNSGRFTNLHEDSCRQADSIQLPVRQGETAKRRALSHV